MEDAQELTTIIEAHNKEYLRIKEAAEQEQIVKWAKWSSSSKEGQEELIIFLEERKAKGIDIIGTLDFKESLPNKNYYKTFLVPQSKATTLDPEEFRKLSKLKLKSLEEIAHSHSLDAASKKGEIYYFIQVFWGLLRIMDMRG